MLARPHIQKQGDSLSNGIEWVSFGEIKYIFWSHRIAEVGKDHRAHPVQQSSTTTLPSNPVPQCHSYIACDNTWPFFLRKIFPKIQPESPQCNLRPLIIMNKITSYYPK